MLRGCWQHTTNCYQQKSDMRMRRSQQHTPQSRDGYILLTENSKSWEEKLKYAQKKPTLSRWHNKRRRDHKSSRNSAPIFAWKNRAGCWRCHIRLRNKFYTFFACLHIKSKWEKKTIRWGQKFFWRHFFFFRSFLIRDAKWYFSSFLRSRLNLFVHALEKLSRDTSCSLLFLLPSATLSARRPSHDS